MRFAFDIMGVIDRLKIGRSIHDKSVYISHAVRSFPVPYYLRVRNQKDGATLIRRGIDVPAEWFILIGLFTGERSYLRACLDRVELLNSIQLSVVVVAFNAGKLQLILHRVQLLALGQL